MSLKPILSKKQKTLEDARFLYDKIQGMSFFKGFFARNLRTLSYESILWLCLTLEYEELSTGDHLFQKGDPADKFYVVLSGYTANIPQKDDSPRKSLKHIPRKKAKAATQVPSQHHTLANSLTKLPELSRDPSADQISTPISPEKSPLLKRFGTVCKKLTLRQATMIDDKWGGPLSSSLGVLEEEDPNASCEDIDKMFQKEEDAYDDLCDPQKQRQYDREFDDIVYYTKEGESLGEFSFRNELPRNCDVVCKSDCGFLVLSRQQFDLIKLRRERQKEDFLKATFTFLDTDNMTPLYYSYFLTSFRTEAFNKGSYVTVEGKIGNKQPKFYVIAQGECMIEKNYILGRSSSPNKSQTYSGTVSAYPIQIAVVGKGMLVGEEILITQDRYSYSVKALTETVIVHSICNTNYETEAFAKFNEIVTELYNKKNKQRKIIFESSKKEYEARYLQSEDTESPKPKSIPPIVTGNTKAYLKSLNSFIKPEQKSSFLKTSQKSLQDIASHSDYNLTDAIKEEDEKFVRRNTSAKIPTLIRNKNKLLNIADMEDFQKLKMEKLKAIKKITEITASLQTLPTSVSSKNLEASKLFTKTSKVKVLTKRQSVHPSIDTAPLSPSKKTEYEPTQSLLREVAKGVYKFQLSDQDYVDLRGFARPEKLPYGDNSTRSTVGLTTRLPSPATDLKNSNADEIKTALNSKPNPPGLRSYLFPSINMDIESVLPSTVRRPSFQITSMAEFCLKGSMDLSTTPRKDLMESNEAQHANLKKQHERSAPRRSKQPELSVAMLDLKMETDTNTIHSKSPASRDSPTAIYFGLTQQGRTNHMSASRLHAKKEPYSGLKMTSQQFRSKVFKKTVQSCEKTPRQGKNIIAKNALATNLLNQKRKC